MSSFYHGNCAAIIFWQNVREQNGFTSLMAAVQSGRREMVEFLVRRGAELNTQDNVSGT